LRNRILCSFNILMRVTIPRLRDHFRLEGNREEGSAEDEDVPLDIPFAIDLRRDCCASCIFAKKCCAYQIGIRSRRRHRGPTEHSAAKSPL
jgi:hypothetical protein